MSRVVSGVVFVPEIWLYQKIALLTQSNFLRPSVVNLRDPVVEATHTYGQVVKLIVAARLVSYHLLSILVFEFVRILQVDLHNECLEKQRFA